jgi:superfamily II DNA or RNA helicase
MSSIIKNNCKTSETVLQPIQKKLAKYFVPSTEQKGLLLMHQVGSGKTCTAINIASNFEETYTILWVTKRTLLKVVEQNLFGKNICHPKINSSELGNTYQKRFGHFNKVTKKAWMTPISYKSFSNLYKKKSSIYKKLVERNGTLDPFNKTLIIIDEGHNLFSNDPNNISLQEKANYKLVQEMIFNSYNISGKDSAKLLILSATPDLNGIEGLFQLLNIMMENPSERINSNINDELINKIKIASKKYVSYYDPSSNPSIFAKKYIERIVTKVSKDNSNLILSHCKNTECREHLKNEYRNNQQSSFKKCIKNPDKSEKIKCLENTIIWNDVVKKEYKFSSIKFDKELINKRLPLISTKMAALLKNINLLDKLDKIKSGKTFKHVIYVEKSQHVSLLLSVLIANNYNIITKPITKLTITNRQVKTTGIVLNKYGKNKNKNVAVFSNTPIYNKYIGKNLVKKMLSMVNSRPANNYGENIRFSVIDRNYLEGISLFDTKYLHILTPPTNNEEMTQLIGRVVRFCGHKGLPFKPDIGWDINILMYENYINSINIDNMIKNLKGQDDTILKKIKTVIINNSIDE